MYELIFSTKLLTAALAISLLVTVSMFLGSKRLWASALMFIPAPALAAAFLAIALCSGIGINRVDLVSVFLYEVFVLIVFLFLFKKAKKDVLMLREADVVRALFILLALHVLASVPNFGAQGYGIFSDANRLDYLAANSYSKYLTYFAILISAMEAFFLGALLTSRGYLGLIGWFIVVLNFSASIGAGSKGAFLLWVLTVVGVIDFRATKLKLGKIIFFALFVCCLGLVSSVIVSRFIGIEFGAFMELAFSRFFLSNDARALAFDLRPELSDYSNLLTESFRSAAKLIGSPPTLQPLGVLLYEQGLSIGGGVGANASFVALAVYFSPEGFVVIPVGFGLIGVSIIYLFDKIFRCLVKSVPKRIAMSTCLLTATNVYSQDFLGFQLLMIIVVGIFVGLFLSQYIPTAPILSLKNTRILSAVINI